MMRLVLPSTPCVPALCIVLASACTAGSDHPDIDPEPADTPANPLDPATIARRMEFRQLAGLIEERSAAAPLACTYRVGTVEHRGTFRVESSDVEPDFNASGMDFSFVFHPVGDEEEKSMYVAFEAWGALSEAATATGTRYDYSLSGTVTDVLSLAHSTDRMTLEVAYMQTLNGIPFDWVRCDPSTTTP